MNALPAAPGDRELAHAGWRKSSRSNGSNTCVEVGSIARGTVVRDSTKPDGDVLLFSPHQWSRFLEAADGHDEAQLFH